MFVCLSDLLGYALTNVVILVTFLVKETEDLYLGVTLPCILKEQFSLDWVYNILGNRCFSVWLYTIIYSRVSMRYNHTFCNLMDNSMFTGQFQSLYFNLFRKEERTGSDNLREY